MDVILLQKVANLGNIGDRVKVRSGYGRNFLLPQGKATLATADNIARFEARRAELERMAREHLSSAEERAAAMRDVTRSSAARCACRTGRCVPWAITSSICICMRMSTCSCP